MTNEYPHNMHGEHYPLDVATSQVGPGWSALVTTLWHAARRHELTITQIKEKLGGLRFYVSGVKTGSVYELLDIVESLSYYICEECGEPGELHDVGGWLYTRCEEHMVT